MDTWEYDDMNSSEKIDYLVSNNQELNEELLQLKRQVSHYKSLNIRYRKQLERYLVEIRNIEKFLDEKNIPNLKDGQHTGLRISNYYSLFERIKLLGDKV